MSGTEIGLFMKKHLLIGVSAFVLGAATTAYLYSTYEEECEAAPTNRDKIMILGGGPNRIGQGIEFDYCCVQAAYAMKHAGFESIMVNCNPETVSTDYDTSDRLYFEPLTLEDVLEIVEVEKPKGVIVQFGGQTPLKLARALAAAGVPIIGTSPDSIDLAEDRERFQGFLSEIGLLQPPNRTARSTEAALVAAGEIGYPLVVRPSYVLGGRAMQIVHDRNHLARAMAELAGFDLRLNPRRRATLEKVTRELFPGGDLARAEERLAREQAASDASGGYLGMNL
jgi:carbamoyl-phosphate synthase large subunit